MTDNETKVPKPSQAAARQSNQRAGSPRPPTRGATPRAGSKAGTRTGSPRPPTKGAAGSPRPPKKGAKAKKPVRGASPRTTKKDAVSASGARAGATDVKAAAPADRAKGVPNPKRIHTKAEIRTARRAKIGKIIACVVVLLLALLLAIMVGDSDYRATAIGWTPFVACVAAIAGAFVYLQVLKRSLVLEEASEFGSCQRGQMVRFGVRFRNRCPLFFTRIEAHFFVTDLFGNQTGHSVTTLALSPFEVYEMKFGTRFDHIGVYRAGLDRVVVSDFLRLFTATIEGPKRTVVQVTPHIVRMDRLRLSNEAIMETTRARRSIVADSSNYAGVREYVKGDPLKTIHWKLSAKQRKYYTRVYEAYTNSGLDIVMDFTGPAGSPDDMMSMFDCVVETALSAARYAQEHNVDVELHWVNRYGKQINKCGITSAELPELIAEMPLFSSEEAHRLEALDVVKRLAASAHGRGNMVVCSANPTPDLMTALIQVKERRRAPLLFAVAPKRLEGRDRDRWEAPFSRLDNAGVGYKLLSDAQDIEGVE